ncbi:uncharacterized protein LOC112467613 [Temnothorax curvispinosus]|uniref:Uncharacterized protein LOC112467613 n=1 Tax=Temnothorax curvispinosus TaxID=300111 RepID=A0A6J1RGX4_9HYME|nr:uncharacterized protein LOC112467613 [Temnothorax curvispinosus]XP_024892066.1 uncharacterized protein LOC112467613 [Temnothorax curvispinosus]XP_024892067.1 uncharacterized protein LOC112467613 [Temnothorax curvispinosus]
MIQWNLCEILACLLKTTVSSIEDPMDNFGDNDENAENIEPNHGPRNKKRRGDPEACTNAIERIASAICDNNDVPIDLPPPPVIDEVDSFLSMLGCQLRELVLRKRREIMKIILDVTYDALTEQ